MRRAHWVARRFAAYAGSQRRILHLNSLAHMSRSFGTHPGSAAAMSSSAQVQQSGAGANAVPGTATSPSVGASLAAPAAAPVMPALGDATVATRTWVVSPSAAPAELEASLAEAAALLRQGELVAFPTETVYGLGGNALSSSALAGIFVAKGRPSDNPLIVHIHSFAQLHALGRNIPRLALRLAEKFWPGPLTLIVPTSYGEHAASSAARAGLDCVGVRMPNHPVALALLRACGVPLAGPSANLSGRPSPTTAAHVAADLTGRIAGIVDGGAAEGVGLESTVVECSNDADGAEGQGWVTILRPGGVTREMLEQVAGKGRVRIDPALAQAEAVQEVDQLNAPVQPLPKQTGRRGAERAQVAELLGSPSPAAAATAATAASSSAAAASPSPSSPLSPASAASPTPKAPGMKYTHYAPRAPLLLVEGALALMLRTADDYLARGSVVGLLATRENEEAIAKWIEAKGAVKDGQPQPQVLVQYCGHRADLSSVARELYACLRAFDETNVQIILSESFDDDSAAAASSGGGGGGLSEAVMNRLRKAAGGRVIREPRAAATRTD